MDDRIRAQLRERLRRLGVRKGTAHIGRAPSSPSPSPSSLHETIGGREVVTPRGAFHLCEETFPPDHLHGRYPLGRVLSAPITPLPDLLIPAGTPPIPVKHIGFLDTETIGLAGGTGTFAFLVGLGIVTSDGVRVRQYFMRDLDEEPALLEHLAQDLARWDVRAVATYNGRAFDIPLLETRFLLNAIPSPLRDLAHLDLLIHARRLWRPRIRRCSLGDVETHILGHQRDMLDIPGWLVPTVYREYLRTRDPHPLRQIFYHNLHDILSLITLADIILRAWDDPWSEPALAPEDFIARSRHLIREGRWQEAEHALRHALHHSRRREHRRAAYALLSDLLKRQQRWEEAIEVWQAWADEFPADSLTPYEELAKYYEWHVRDLERALHWTEQALRVLRHAGKAAAARWEPAFRHRQERLCRRLARTGGK